MSGPLGKWLEGGPAIGAAAVVAVLAAVGVAGDFLPRMVRNYASTTAFLVSLAIIAAMGLMAMSMDGHHVVSLVVLTSALVGTVHLGVTSLSHEDTPRVGLSWAANEARSHQVIEVTARATSLKYDQLMLVQVVAFPLTPDPLTLADQCIGSRRLDDAADPHVAVLSWQELGSSPTGDSSVDTTIEVPVGAYQTVCALVLLRDRNYRLDDRFTWTYASLN